MSAQNSGALAVAIADRLLDPDAVTASIGPLDRASLRGLAGTALLHARLSAVHDRFAMAAVTHWNHVARCLHPAASGGTFAGTGAMAASVILGSPYLPDPHRLHEQRVAAIRWLAARACAIADDLDGRLRHGLRPTSWAIYDTINGLTGIGRVLLAAANHGHHEAQPGLDVALTALTSLITSRTENRPGWWLPATACPAKAGVHPSGAAPTGLAHGIAGPLALLAGAHCAGYRVPRQDTAIRAAADWLLHWRDSATDNWPPHVNGDQLDQDASAPVRGRRDAWCYGVPGISTALTLATAALDDVVYRAVAQQAMRTLAARDPCSWDVDGPTLCHGYAGILQTAHLQTDLAHIAAAQIVKAANPDHRYLVQHSERNTATDNPGFLTGAAGVALALADYADLPSNGAPLTRWDGILLLS